MMKNLTKTLAFITVAVLIPGVATASPGTGSKTKYDLRIGKCDVDSIKVKWNLDSIMGEPTVYGTFKWTGSDCRLPYSTTIWLRLEHNAHSNAYGYVPVSPVTPDANGGYGYDTKGSPSWRNAVCGYRGTEKQNCYSASDAKAIWRDSQVTDFEVTW